MRSNVFIIAGLLLCASRCSAADRPNVLFLFADDQRADTIGALGNPVVKTPNLDRLVNRGLAFENAYCMGGNSGAVCSPSRNMLLSGRSYFRFGRQASASDPNFPASLKAAGYETYHHGKRGNTALAIQKLFDHDKYVADDVVRRSGEAGKSIADDAISFLKARSGSKPFFMYLAFASPHDPRVATERHLATYVRERIPLPRNYLPHHPFDNGELKIRDEALAPWPRTEEVIRRHLHEYYSVITALDEQAGRILTALDELGLTKNTIVIYSSDHGLAVGSHGLMGKQSLYEHSMKSPLIIAGPGIPKGRSAAFAYLMDVYPTVLDLVGAPIPRGLDGDSLAPVIRGEKPVVRDVMFTAYRDVQRAVRRGRWKLIRYPKINKSQLFDLESDPDELRDLSESPDRSARVRELTALLESRQARFGDELRLTSDTPAKAEVDLSFFAK